MVAVLVVPGLIEALAGLLELLLGGGGAPARRVEGLRQLGDLKGVAGLQTAVDRPGIAAGLGDQIGNAQPVQLHCPAHLRF